MSILITCVTQKVPAWVETAFQDYSQRCVAPWNIIYQPVGLKKRAKGRELQALEKESDQVIAMLKPGDYSIGMDPKGKTQTSEQFSASLVQLLNEGLRPVFIIGAPEGLTPAIKSNCKALWSLGPMTLPHTLAKVTLAEQIFRAWSIEAGHPYHRGGQL